jgi:hypothetical protein
MDKKMKKFMLLACVVLSFAGCKEEVKPTVAPVSDTVKSAPIDVGTIEQVTVTAKGVGTTPGAAINDALKTAISQVNGTRLDALSVTVDGYTKATAMLDEKSSWGRDKAVVDATIRSKSFVDMLLSQTEGVISSFKVLDMSSPLMKDGNFSVEIEARVARFVAPADSGKVKIVIAPLRSQQSEFDIGGRLIPADEVLAATRRQIVDALTQTGRFSVLERQFDDEIENELSLIDSGKTRKMDAAKLGQAMSADIVWVGVVNDLAYRKSVTHLRTSDRDLVGYSGGWSVSQRIVNLTTRQILQSDTLQGRVPSIPMTTLGARFDGSATLQQIQNGIARSATEAILANTFPITIAERDGNNVVLSQGGQAVTVGATYQVYLRGKEIKDPQTGATLGFMDSPCCEVKITRVEKSLSYGTLENARIDLSGVVTGTLHVREIIATKSAGKTAVKAAANTKRDEWDKPKAGGTSQKAEDW